MDAAFVEETEKAAQSQLFHLISIQIPGDELPFHIADSNHPLTYKGITYDRFPVKFTGASISSDGSVDKATLVVANVSREIMYYVEAFQGLRNMRVKIKAVYARFLDETYVFNADGTVTVAPNPEVNVDAYVEDEYIIDNYTANEQTVTFQLDPIIDLDIRLPRRRFMVDSCYWNYEDPTTCKYPVNHRIGVATVTAGSTSFMVPTGTWVPTPGSKFKFYNDVTGSVFTVQSYDESTRSGVLAAASTITVVSTDVILVGVCPKTFKACKERQNHKNFGGFPGISANRRIFL